MSKLLHEDETFSIIGACMEVHNTLGQGFLEAVYQEALAIELSTRGVEYAKEVPLAINYKGQVLKKQYAADFICFGFILLETKALTSLTSNHDAQVLNYLKATGMKLGLLVNFGAPKLSYRRLVR